MIKTPVKRFAEDRIRSDLEKKIVLLAGPRQAGKTTLSRQLGLRHVYLSFDSEQDRKQLRSKQWDRSAELIIFDELHKLRRWKAWLKGIYDTEGIPPGILVTGSARLEVFRRGGDSLAGRHYLHRLHPLTVREVKDDIEPADALERILTVGGFPEPFLLNDLTESRRWRRGHMDSILREDLLDLERVRDIKSIEVLVELLKERVGSTVSMASLARDLSVSPHTVKHWLEILENLYVVFAVRPYHRNIARSLLKESKFYFYDTGAVAQAGADPGAVLENAVACALKRELDLAEDLAGREACLMFLRDKEKREVDFLAVLDKRPQYMVEVKLGDDSFSKSLAYFHELIPTATALQVVKGLRRPRDNAERTLRMVPATDYLATVAFVHGDMASKGGAVRLDPRASRR